MTYYRSDQCLANSPALNARGPEEIVIPFSITLSANVANGDIIGLCKLPKNHVLTGCFINLPDLDSNGTPTVIVDVGLYEDDSEAAATDPTIVDVDCLVDGSTTGQAGGLITAPNVSTFLSVATSNSDRIVAITLPTGPATGDGSGDTISGFIRARNKRGLDS